MSCGVGCRRSLVPTLLWLWARQAAVALIRPLAWKPPHASGAALEKNQKKKKSHFSASLGGPQVSTGILHSKPSRAWHKFVARWLTVSLWAPVQVCRCAWKSLSPRVSGLWLVTCVESVLRYTCTIVMKAANSFFFFFFFFFFLCTFWTYMGVVGLWVQSQLEPPVYPRHI